MKDMPQGRAKACSAKSKTENWGFVLSLKRKISQERSMTWWVEQAAESGQRCHFWLCYWVRLFWWPHFLHLTWGLYLLKWQEQWLCGRFGWQEQKSTRDLFCNSLQIVTTRLQSHSDKELNARIKKKKNTLSNFKLLFNMTTFKNIWTYPSICCSFRISFLAKITYARTVSRKKRGDGAPSPPSHLEPTAEIQMQMPVFSNSPGTFESWCLTPMWQLRLN